MTDKDRKQVKQENEPELKRQDDAIEDLEPEKEEEEAVKGGTVAAWMKV